MRDRFGERGAAAVEFALVVPLLLILVLGIAEFGRAYNVQTVLSGAAREGVRVMALENNPDEAKARTIEAATGLALTDSQITVEPLATCLVTTIDPSAVATVTVKYELPFLTKFFGTSITLTGKGVMRCNG